MGLLIQTVWVLLPEERMIVELEFTVMLPLKDEFIQGPVVVTI
jgi:hypothetical protein